MKYIKQDFIKNISNTRDRIKTSTIITSNTQFAEEIK